MRARLPRLVRPRSIRVKVIASVLVTILTLTSLAAFAYLSRGFPAKRLDLNDAGIWVTNDSLGVFGRQNKSASSLDAYFNPQGGAQEAYALDIAQDAGTVLAWDKANSRLTPVDVAAARLVNDSAVSVPPSAVIDIRGGTVAALDPATGKIWASRYVAGEATPPDLTALAPSGAPLAEVGAPKQGQALGDGARYSALAVGVDGVVHAADVTGKTVTITPSGSGFEKPVVTKGPKRESVDLTVVGDHVVILDVIGGTLSVDAQAPSKRAEISAGTLPQQPSADAPDVLIAAPTGLFGYSVTTPQASSRALSDVGQGPPAAPVQVAGCVYGAWAGTPGTIVRGCGGAQPQPLTIRDAGATLTRPVFRVNRSQVMVNDQADGQVYDLDSLQRVDNWQQVREATSEDAISDEQPVTPEEDKPKANPDRLGARPGRSTILHVLDNDTDKGGRILSISSVTQPGNTNASVRIAPDGQSLIYSLGEQGGGSSFTYQLSNGVAEDRGNVEVVDKGLTENTPPTRLKRDQPPLAVASGGTLPVTVLDLWRDDEGDPIALESVEPKSGTGNITSDGRIEFTAAQTPTPEKVDLKYAVTDGRSDPVPQDLSISVLGSGEVKSSPVLTQPDVARGEAGRPIPVYPLLNDIPGADPLNPKATMRLAEAVAEKPGLSIETDLVSGQVLVTAEQPGHYFLDYHAAFGSAAVAPGSMRIDVDPVREDERSPVAMPDQASVRGTGSVLVDVLANDSDPLGSVLTVEQATPADPTQLQAAVVDGRWVRVTPSTGSFTANPQFVTYTVSNGVTAPVESTIAVTQLPAVSPDQILTRPDFATVRAGDATTIQVLENDVALSGARLSLLGNIAGAKTPGQLTIYNPGATDATGGDNGSAYISGDTVRFLAPERVSAQFQVVVEYVAQTESGDRATGQIEVTVTPEPTETMTNRAPTPRPVEARAVSGETLTIPVNPTNNDPDGDSTAVIGIASAPQLGRILGFSPTGITYQAYPDESSQGTDSFSYIVADRYGATATSMVRVGVTPPARPQPAVASPLSITAAPGSDVTLYPLLSAAFVKSDPVTVLPLDRFNQTPPEGASVDVKTNAVRAVAGAAKQRPVQFSYGLTGNGGDSAPSTVTVYAVDDYKNPPRVVDVTVKPDGSGKAVADVFKTAYDPDGDSTKLKVTRVGHPDAKVDGGKVTVPVTGHIRAIPYEVTDESGATSAAVIYVPSEGTGGPYLRTGKTIHVDEGQSVTVKVADYVEDPQGKPVTITFPDLMKASPSGRLTASAPSGSELTVTGAAGYVGPGAVVAEFTNGKTLDDPEGIKTFVSIPVQVGPETPVLRCPNDTIPVVRGGREVSRDIMSMCSVWTPNPEQARKLTFEGTWVTPLDGVSIRNGRALTIDASSDATPGQAGVIAVTAAGTQATPSNLNVVVVEAPKATLTPVSLPEMKAGERRDVDLLSYFSSPLKDPKPQALSITKTSGMDAQASVSGTTASITPGSASYGRMEFQVVMTDVAEKNATDQNRRVTGTIAFDVFTKPDAPGAPQPQTALMSRSATLSWAAPASNGAPILDYELDWGGGRQTCAASPCTVTGLTNGQDYTFKVRARNKADWSDFSPGSAPTRPNAQPLAVVPTQTAAGDGSITLTWPSAQGEGSAIESYLVSVDGRSLDAGPALTYTVTGLSNGPAYTITVTAKNNSTTGPGGSVVGYAAGTPSLGGPLTPVQAAPADSSVTTVTITANGANQNGPQPVTYSFFRNGSALGACTNITSNVCVDQGVTNGQSVTYSASVSTVFLGVTRTSPTASAAPFTPYGIPAAWGTVTARAANLNNQVALSYTVPASRGSGSTVSADLGQGWVQVSSPGPNGGAGSATLPGNQGGGQVSMRVCNEQNQCSTSGPVPYNAYGDTAAPQLSGGSVNGTTVCLGSTQANANGWGATLTLTGPGVNQTTSGSGALSIGQVCADVGYSATATFTATITDSAHPNGEPGRSTKTATWSGSTPPPPPPPTNKVFVSHSNGLAYIRLEDWAPGSRVYCWVDPVGPYRKWTATWTVDGNGNRGADTNGDQGVLNDPDNLLGEGQYTKGDLCIPK